MHIALVVGILGLVTSTLYSALALAGALRFLKRRRMGRSCAFSPPVSLLKPLHGSEQGLEQRLQSFFQQDYPAFEIIFCARSEEDPALLTAARVASRYPQIPAKFLASGNAPYANAKVWSLERMHSAAQHEVLVISDSDVSVTAGYLRAVVAPLADDRIGLVTCLYRGVATDGSLWSRLEAVGMSVEMSSGVLVAEMFEGMKFALGPTMVVRRAALAAAGGFRAIGDHHGDDFKLGSLMAAHGHKVVLSTHAIEHHILNTSFASSALHQIRWMRGTRFYRPLGHLGTVLTFSLPSGLLAAAGALLGHRPMWAALFLIWSWGSRAALSALVSSLVVRDPHPWRSALLFPLRDFLGFFFWTASYLGNKVLWRGEVYELLRGGLMRKRTLPASGKQLLPFRWSSLPLPQQQHSMEAQTPDLSSRANPEFLPR